jgi:hypothetical protein
LPRKRSTITPIRAAAARRWPPFWAGRSRLVFLVSSNSRARSRVARSRSLALPHPSISPISARRPLPNRSSTSTC